MSTVCLPAASILDGPLPSPPPHSLLQVPGVLVSNQGERWIGGANFISYITDPPSFFDPNSAGTFRVKDEGSGNSLPAWGAFIVYLPITCSTFSIGDPDEFSGRAERVLAAVESFAVEQALSQGVALSTNPFLADVDADVIVAGAQAPDAALGYLEDAIGATGRRGMIHATPAVAASWFGNPQTGDSPLVTANGTPVAAGGGYIGATPSGQGAAGEGQAWVYATGPVQVRHSEVLTHETLSEAMDRSINEVTFRAERYVLVSWDQALQATVLVDWDA